MKQAFQEQNKEYLKATSDELETNIKSKNITDLYRGIKDLDRLPA
jgi:hypothetical protein